MRPLLCAAFVAVVAALAVPALSARADGEGDLAARAALLELQNKALRADVDYLRAREDSTSKYLASLGTASQNLGSGVAAAREQGFEAAAVSANGRMALAKSLDGFAADLAKGLPAPTKAEETLKAAAEELRKQLPH